MTTTDELVTPQQAAVVLGVTSRTVVRWAEAGTLPTATRTAGGHRRFRRADVDQLAREQRGEVPHREAW